MRLCFESEGTAPARPLRPACQLRGWGGLLLQICCSSPERFLCGGRGGLLEARPIKGTAPRVHGDPAADAAAAAALLASEKVPRRRLLCLRGHLTS